MQPLPANSITILLLSHVYSRRRCVYFTAGNVMWSSFDTAGINTHCERRHLLARHVCWSFLLSWLHGTCGSSLPVNLHDPTRSFVTCPLSAASSIIIVHFRHSGLRAVKLFKKRFRLNVGKYAFSNRVMIIGICCLPVALNAVLLALSRNTCHLNLNRKL